MRAMISCWWRPFRVLKISPTHLHCSAACNAPWFLWLCQGVPRIRLLGSIIYTELQISNLRTQMPNWIRGPHCNSARPIPQTPSNKNFPSTNQPPKRLQHSSVKSNRENTPSSHEGTSNKPSEHRVSQSKVHTHIFYLNNLLCVLNL